MRERVRNHIFTILPLSNWGVVMAISSVTVAGAKWHQYTARRTQFTQKQITVCWSYFFNQFVCFSAVLPNAFGEVLVFVSPTVPGNFTMTTWLYTADFCPVSPLPLKLQIIGGQGKFSDFLQSQATCLPSLFTELDYSCPDHSSVLNAQTSDWYTVFYKSGYTPHICV